MRAKLNHADLLEGIQSIQNVIPSRATLPVLLNFLLETHEGLVRITATDLDMGISKNIPAEIQEDGKITIPARRFGEIVRELPEEKDITISVKKNNSIHINCGACFFKLMGMPAEEFPKIPKIDKEKNFALKQKELKQMLELTVFTVPHDEPRYVLNGMFFDLKDAVLNLVATDGRRLSLVKRNIEKTNSVQMIVPVKTIQELSRLLKEEGDVKIIYSANQVCFELNGTIIISRLIEGEFPGYAQVIPEEKKTKLLINREAFLQAVKRAALFTTAEALPVKLEAFKDKMVISKIVPEIGEARDEIPLNYGGKEFAIGFNPYYLIDVLKNLKEEEVPFELEEGDKPGVIRLPEYIHIVLPMQLD